MTRQGGADGTPARLGRRALALLALPALLPARPARGAALRRIEESGTLRVGLDPEDPPFAFLADGRMDGIEPALARLVGRELECAVEFVPASFGALLARLRDGEMEVVMAGVPASPSLTPAASFALPTGARILALVAPTGSGIGAPRDLRGRRVGIGSGGRGPIALGLARRERFELCDYAFFPEVMEALAGGEVEAAFLDAYRFLAFAASRPGLPFAIAFEAGLVPTAPAVRPGDGEFLATLNTALGLLRRRGEVEDVFARFAGFRPAGLRDG